ncbi:hypothetical protein RND71_018218 [Anisodus tanguticus]|uniref:Uncharacterized protein n=1 Tax=Anisodus tanguticus TaxID=243964 RepID=A0AAE1VBV8_9SOLA|nr:hypothetical protein RND71_018218 [Anisodus tanguticus]
MTGTDRNLAIVKPVWRREKGKDGEREVGRREIWGREEKRREKEKTAYLRLSEPARWACDVKLQMNLTTLRTTYDLDYADVKGSTLAEFLTDGDPQGDMNKSMEELQAYDSKGVEVCITLATRCSKQLFAIYKNKEDPFFSAP